MLDMSWERYVPLLKLTIEEIKHIFLEFDRGIEIIGFEAIQLGCKNSNFAVTTSKGRFLLRITCPGSFSNEKIAYELVKGKINVPSLLFHTVKQQRNIFIYQYLEGVSLQKHIIEKNRCSETLLEQAAKGAALIHSIAKDETVNLAQWDVPPYEMWYEIFLDHPLVRARIGEELREKIQRLVFDKHDWIEEIDRCKSFIHCDFRPVNMIVDRKNRLFFVDWESACWGHFLADIGAFFRFRSYFNEANIRLFEKTYHFFANHKLPDHWVELSLFRDLVNPLQLLASNQEAPKRNADLIHVVQETLDDWGYL